MIPRLINKRRSRRQQMLVQRPHVLVYIYTLAFSSYTLFYLSSKNQGLWKNAWHVKKLFTVQWIVTIYKGAADSITPAEIEDCLSKGMKQTNWAIC